MCSDSRGALLVRFEFFLRRGDVVLPHPRLTALSHACRCVRMRCPVPSSVHATCGEWVASALVGEIFFPPRTPPSLNFVLGALMLNTKKIERRSILAQRSVSVARFMGVAVPGRGARTTMAGPPARRWRSAAPRRGCPSRSPRASPLSRLLSPCPPRVPSSRPLGLSCRVSPWWSRFIPTR